MAKCADCGFLAARNRVTRTLDEAEDLFREGLAPLVVDDKGGNPHRGWEHYPVCFHDAQDLTKIIKAAEEANGESAARVNFVLHEDRPCQAFSPWHRGLTARQHQERLERTADKKSDRRWHFVELALVILGNLAAAALGLLDRQVIAPGVWN